MKFVPAFCALVALAALPLTAGRAAATAPAAPAALRYPHALSLDAGAAQYVAETETDAALGGVQVFVAAGLDRETSATAGIAALVAECVLRTPVSGPGRDMLPLRDAVAAQGGSLNYTVDGRSVHYYLEARSENLTPLVRLLGNALAAPDFSVATIAAARGSLTSRIADLEQNALSVGIQMFRRSYYAAGAGGATLGSATSLAGLSSRDLAAFHAANYKRGALSASAVGRVGPDLGAALASAANGLADGAVASVPAAVKPIPATAPRIVAHRDVSAPWIVVGFAAPSPASTDFGAMLVVQSLLADAFERNSVTTLGFVEKSVGAFYLYDAAPASLVVYVNGSQIDPSVALRELLVVSRSLSLKPLAAEPLRHFKATAEGQFVTDSLNLSDRSYMLGTFSSLGLGPDAINAALAALERTSAADVQRVAKAYLQRYIVALVLPRQAGGQ